MRAHEGTARRYAKALYELAHASGDAEAVGRELEEVAAVYAGDAGARDVLTRTAMAAPGTELAALRELRGQVAQALLPEPALGHKHVVADVAFRLDAVENGSIDHGCEVSGHRIEHEHMRRGLGETPDFTPDVAHLIATRSDTGYVDPGPPGRCYKLSAVDVNGNESGCAARCIPAGPLRLTSSSCAASPPRTTAAIT